MVLLRDTGGLGNSGGESIIQRQTPPLEVTDIAAEHQQRPGRVTGGGEHLVNGRRSSVPAGGIVIRPGQQTGLRAEVGVSAEAGLPQLRHADLGAVRRFPEHENVISHLPLGVDGEGSRVHPGVLRHLLIHDLHRVVVADIAGLCQVQILADSRPHENQYKPRRQTCQQVEILFHNLLLSYWVNTAAHLPEWKSSKN